MRINPVLEREMRERVRGVRAVVVLTFFLGLVLGLFAIVYRSDRAVSGRNGFLLLDPTEVGRLGRLCFESTVLFLLVLVLFIVPGLTAAAIAGERERQTLIPMQITLLKPHAIVLGKVQASLAYLLVLLVASVPIMVMSYVIGGVSVVDVVRGLLAVLAVGVLMACIGVAASSLLRSSQAATALAYLAVVLLCIGTFAAYGAMTVLAPEYPNTRKLLLLPNPVMATATVVGGSPITTSRSDTPFTGLRREITGANQARGAMIMPAVGVGPNGFPAVDDDAAAALAAEADADLRNFGLGSLALLSTLAFGCVWAASVRVRAPSENER